MKNLKLIILVTGFLILLIPCLGLTKEAKEWKEEVEGEKVIKLEKIVVTGESKKAPAAVKVPAVVESITKEDFEKRNVVGTDDIIKYLPGIHVRQFAPGGTFGALSIRGTHPWSSRTLVLADDMILSNPLRWGAHKWHLVAPEEIERVDVIHGPYSALYSGNAIGGVVFITTRLPEKREFSAKTSYMYQNFEEYKSDYDLDGYTAHVSYGDKFDKFRIFALFDRLENEANPTSFITRLKKDGTAPAGNPVSGWDYDLDRENQERYILGSRGTRKITNNLFKFKVAYDINSYTQAKIDLGYFRSDSEADKPETYLIDNSSGNKVYSGNVDINGQKYNIAASQFYYREQTQDNYIYAVSFKREPEDGIKTWATASFNNVPKELTQQSTTAPPMSEHGGPGTVTDTDSGWYTFDLKSSYRPSTLPALANHTLTGGYHYDRYFIDGEKWNASDWRRDIRTTFSEGSEGKTETHAVFLQDEWDITDKFMLYLGGRYEWWEGFDGSKSRDVSGSCFTKKFEDKKEEFFSPKVAITFRPDEDWSFRLSLAKTYRFPTITELYYASISSAGIVTKTNPDLKTEEVFAKDFTITRNLGKDGKVRLSFFESSEEDAIFRQTNIYTMVRNYQNIDKARRRGIEFSTEKRRFLLDGLDVMGNITYIEAEILKNTNLPTSEGKTFPYCPKWRANAAISYSPIEDLTLTVAGRYGSKSFWTLENKDTGGGYGGSDRYLVFDTKLMYKFLENWKVSLAVDNLTDKLYHEGHPFPRRIFFAMLEANF